MAMNARFGVCLQPPGIRTAAGGAIPAAMTRIFRTNQKEVYPMATASNLARRSVSLSRNRTRLWTRQLCALLRTSSWAEEDVWVLLAGLVSR